MSPVLFFILVAAAAAVSPVLTIYALHLLFRWIYAPFRSEP